MSVVKHNTCLYSIPGHNATERNEYMDKLVRKGRRMFKEESIVGNMSPYKNILPIGKTSKNSKHI